MENANPISLTRFMLQQQRLQKNAQGDFTFLMSSIQLACKAISMAVRKAGLQGLYGLEESGGNSAVVNVQGEEVKKLDRLSHDVFVNALKSSTTTCILISEEEEKPIVITDPSLQGPYVVAFDPLDGSSNIDCNVSVGSIFSVFKCEECSTTGERNLDWFLENFKREESLVAAGYCMYGSATQMVLSFGQGVQVFTHDPSIGEFILTNKDLKIPEPQCCKNIFSVNEGNFSKWSDGMKNLVKEFKETREYSARYIGSMVSDVNRTLLYGGIFMYPASKAGQGKLRLLYEALPMAFICEQAGGVCLGDNLERVLEIGVTKEKGIHHRVGVFLGCKRDMEIVKQFLECKE